MRTGCIHGRFQPFHNGHFEYFQSASQRCGRLIVGITQYEPDLHDPDSPEHRMNAVDNPFSYWERAEIIRAAANVAGYDLSKLVVVPFPIHMPNAIKNFVENDCIMFTTIYDAWNLQKIRRLKQEKFEVCVLWRRKVKEFEGKEVRRAMRSNFELFRSLVPPGVPQEVQAILAKRTL